MKSIEHDISEIPAQAPVMFLTTVMLPQLMMPLFIFEPRYRAMLAHCLEEERMFCVALLRPGVSEARTQDDFYPVAGLGLVRACVSHPDGTSHLVLQGIARVELVDFVQEEPFRIMRLRELPTVPDRGPEIQRLMEEVRALCEQLIPEKDDERSKLREQMAQITDGGTLADMVAHSLLGNPWHQQEVLEAVAVYQRLKAVLRGLKKEMTE